MCEDGAEGRLPLMLSRAEAWAYFGKEALGRNGFDGLIQSGVVPSVRVGGRILIPREGLEAAVRRMAGAESGVGEPAEEEAGAADG